MPQNPVGIVTAIHQITDDINGIIPCNALVPCFDHLVIHLVYAGEGPVTQMDNTSVSEVRVADEECVWHVSSRL